VTNRESALTTAERPSAIRATIRSPLYRGGVLALFLSGLGYSAAAPQITLFLINDLHVSLATAGLYYLTNLTSPIAGYLIGARSDRTGKRLGLFRLCALAGFVGWLGISFAGQVWIPFVVSAVVLAFSGAATSQLFAAIHDELRLTGNESAEGVISIVRMALTAGWIVGPVLGFFLAAQFGARAMLVATAVFTLAQILPIGLARDPSASPPPSDGTAAPLQTEELVRSRGIRVMLPLLAFTGLYALVYAGEPIKYGYLSIYMRSDLHLPAVISGAVIGIQPLIELLLMPLAVIVARWMGMMHLMIVGALFGVAAYLCFALTADAVGMFAGQACMGAVWGIFAGLGILVAQRLLPQAIATASAIFISSPAIASAVGGASGSIGVSLLGLPLLFLIPAGFCLLASVGIAVLSRRQRGVV
jgi:SET family sugar efflux transporter-like MFS transporter